MGKHTTGAHTALSAARADATVKEVSSYRAHVQWEAIFVKSQRKSHKMYKRAQLSIPEWKSFISSASQDQKYPHLWVNARWRRHEKYFLAESILERNVYFSLHFHCRLCRVVIKECNIKYCKYWHQNCIAQYAAHLEDPNTISNNLHIFYIVHV